MIHRHAKQSSTARFSHCSSRRKNSFPFLSLQKCRSSGISFFRSLYNLFKTWENYNNNGVVQQSVRTWYRTHTEFPLKKTRKENGTVFVERKIDIIKIIIRINVTTRNALEKFYKEFRVLLMSIREVVFLFIWNDPNFMYFSLRKKSLWHVFAYTFRRSLEEEKRQQKQLFLLIISS